VGPDAGRAEAVLEVHVFVQEGAVAEVAREGLEGRGSPFPGRPDVAQQRVVLAAANVESLRNVRERLISPSDTEPTVPATGLVDEAAAGIREIHRSAGWPANFDPDRLTVLIKDLVAVFVEQRIESIERVGIPTFTTARGSDLFSL